MEKGAQIELLRKEHAQAIENFDFDKAELINQQIKRLKNEIIRGNTSLLSELNQAEIEEEKEKLRGESAQQNALMMQERIRIQKRFHERFQQLQTKHTQQTTDLTYQHTATLEKEMTRVVPEAEKLFERAKILGREHQYNQARLIYQEGQDTKTAVLEERRKKCALQFERQTKILKEQQDREMALLAAKQEAALEKLSQKTENREALLSMKLKVKELKVTSRLNDKKGSPYLSRTARNTSSIGARSFQSDFN